MTSSFVYTYSVTQADVIWVVGQIKAELEQFQLLYPELIPDREIEDFTHALRVFLVNDVVSRAEMIIGRDTGGKHYQSDDQRVFEFDHGERQGRAAFEQSISKRRSITRGAGVQSFMSFNHNITNKPRAEQLAILSGTAWSACVPGSGSASVTYSNKMVATGHAWSRNLGVTRWQ